MKRIILAAGLLLVAGGCSNKKLAELQIDTKNPTSVPSATLFSNAQRNLWDAMNETNVNRNVFRLFAQQWTETTYPDESQYNLITRAIPDNFWSIMYRDVLRDLKEASMLISAEKPLTDADNISQKNRLAVIELLNVYSYSVLVTVFGNIPYTEALDINRPTPKYDDAKTVYADLLKRLDAALASLNSSGGSFGSADLVYGGNAAKWMKFGNALKIRMGILIADVDPAMAKATVESAYSKAFASAADRAALQYMDAFPNTNPLWLDLVQSGRHDYIPANTIVDMMNTLEDPRRPAYFTMKDGKYVGGIYGTTNSWSSFSQLGDRFFTPTFEGLILGYDEQLFYLAEAAARGWNVGGTAAELYNKAVMASMSYWGVSDAEAQTYLARPDVAYATAAGDWKQKIARQEYLALYNRGLEAWTLYRRLDAPTLRPLPGSTTATVPKRFTYPAQEQTLNGANVQTASTAIGGDSQDTKLFWDVN